MDLTHEWRMETHAGPLVACRKKMQTFRPREEEKNVQEEQTPPLWTQRGVTAPSNTCAAGYPHASDINTAPEWSAQFEQCHCSPVGLANRHAPFEGIRFMSSDPSSFFIHTAASIVSSTAVLVGPTLKFNGDQSL